eukprot:jgi/Mesvir1/12763/Mv26052-RA.1
MWPPTMPSEITHFPSRMMGRPKCIIMYIMAHGHLVQVGPVHAARGYHIMNTLYKACIMHSEWQSPVHGVPKAIPLHEVLKAIYFPKNTLHRLG